MNYEVVKKVEELELVVVGLRNAKEKLNQGRLKGA